MPKTIRSQNFGFVKPDGLKAGQDKLLMVKTPMVDVIKKSGVREEADRVNVGSDFYDALDEKVKDLINRSVRRASDNGRKTVKARDV